MNKNHNAKHSRPDLTTKQTDTREIPKDFTFTLTPIGFKVSHQLPVPTLINMLFSVVATLCKDKEELYQPIATATDNLLAYCFPQKTFPTREELLAQMEQEATLLKQRIQNGEGADIDFAEWRAKQLEKIKQQRQQQQQQQQQAVAEAERTQGITPEDIERHRKAKEADLNN